MFLTRKFRWKSSAEVFSTKKVKKAFPFSDLLLLESVWKRQSAPLLRFCVLLGIEDRYIVVRPVSAAAASEINMRSAQLVRELNKNFRQPWIKGIKTASTLKI